MFMPSAFLTHVMRISGLARLAATGIALLTVSSHAQGVAELRVSSNAALGQYRTIQEAVNACTTFTECRVLLVDATYTLQRPVWIEGHRNVTIEGNAGTNADGTIRRPRIMFASTLLASAPNPLRSAPFSGGSPPANVARLFTLPWLNPVTGAADPNRPSGWLMWPYVGMLGVVPLAARTPGHTNDTATGFSSSGFQYNGMFVVHRSQDIVFRNLRLTSTPAFFQNRGVWVTDQGSYDVVFGNVGITMNQTLRTTVQDCEISGFFSAFYIQGRNVGGAFGQPNPNDLDEVNIIPLSRYGQVGDHLIERNWVHNNWWFLYNEIDWDLGSTIRFNVAFQNMNKAFQYGDTLTDPAANSDEMNNMTGGFIYAKDAVIVPHRIHNNTILSSPIILGHGYWRRNTQSLFFNNVMSFVNLRGLTQTLGPQDQHNLLGWYGEMAWFNTIQLIPGVSATFRSAGNFPVTDSRLLGVHGPGTNCAGGCFLNNIAVSRYAQQIQPNQLFNSWNIAQGADIVIRSGDINWMALTTNTVRYVRAPGDTVPIDSVPNIVWRVRETNGYNMWGLFTTLAEPANYTGAQALARRNMWSLSNEIMGGVDSTVTSVASVFDLAPVWGTPVVNATVRNQAWPAADLGSPDGSVADRGAFQFDSVANQTILGGVRNAVMLSIRDQSIVHLRGSTISFPVFVDQRQGTQTLSRHFLNMRIDSVRYWVDFPFSDVDDPDATNVPWSPPAGSVGGIIRTPTWGGASGDTLAFPIVNAATIQDYARFDVYMSAIDPISGETVRTVGSYVYRRTEYRLEVDFCAQEACTQILPRTRVGDRIWMRVRVLDLNGNIVTNVDVSNLYLTPGPGAVMMDNRSTPSRRLDTARYAASFRGSIVGPVHFETVGQIRVTAAAQVGALGALGEGSILVAAGPPFRVQWVNPQTTSIVPCPPPLVNADAGALDTAGTLRPTVFCNEMPADASNPAELRVFDEFGNQVTEPARVRLTGLSTAVGRGTATVSATATGFLATATGTTDSSGRLAAFVLGSRSGMAPFDPAIAFPRTFVQYEAQVVDAAGVPVVRSGRTAPVDTARVRLGPPEDRLAWRNEVAIDTLVRTSVRMEVMVTRGIDPVATFQGQVRIFPSTSASIRLFRDEARTQPILDSLVDVVNGVGVVFAASESPTPWNRLMAASDLFPEQAVWDSLRFRNPPTPPTPVPDSAAFLDLNCDGVADVARVWLRSAGAGLPAVIDTTRVVPDTFRIVYGGTTTTVSTTSWSTVGGNFGILDVPLPAGVPATSALTGTLSMEVRLRRAPALDTFVVAGTAIDVRDRIAPRPTSGAILENFNPGVTADTVTLSFSEAVNFTGTVWPFITRNTATGPIVNTASIQVARFTEVEGGRYRFVITGNTGGTVVRSGQIVSIDPASALVDLAGNHGRGDACVSDTTTLVLVPQPVPIVAAWLHDANGDGSADRATVRFFRALRPVDVPDSLRIAFGGGTRLVDLIGAATTDSTTFSITLTTPFPRGLTRGSGPDGSGTVTLRKGEGASGRTETSVLADSVPPIPLRAELRYDPTGVLDTLLVDYSEPLAARTGTAWMLVQRLSDAPVGATGAVVVGADYSRRAILVPPGAAAYALPGDSIRLPVGAASNLVATNGTLPTSGPAAPYVVVLGGDPPPSSAWMLDANGDGRADRAVLRFRQALSASPTFTIRWPDASGNALDSVVAGPAAFTTSDAGRTVVIDLPTPFDFGVTSVDAGRFPVLGTQRSGVGGLVSTVGFAIADSVGPVPTRAELRYGTAGTIDTLVVTYSEALASRSGTAWMLNQRFSDAPVGATAGAASADPRIWRLIVPVDAANYAVPGDSIRLPAGAASNLRDLLGNLPASPRSPYVRVLGGDPSPSSSWILDANADGRADRVVMRWRQPLATRPSFELSWPQAGGTALDTRAVDSGAYVMSADRREIVVNLGQPFAYGSTGVDVARFPLLGRQRSGMDGFIAMSQFAIADSVTPIPMDAELVYGRAGTSDTLRVTYSEPLINGTGASWMLLQRLADQPVEVASGQPIAGNARVWNLLVNPDAAVYALPGDSIRLPPGATSVLRDLLTNLPATPHSPYVRVRGADPAPLASWILDVNADGRADRVVMSYARPLGTSPSYVVRWPDSSGNRLDSVTAATGAYTLSGDRRTVTIDLAQPFDFGVTGVVAGRFPHLGRQTGGIGLDVSTDFPIADSVDPVITSARLSYASFSEDGQDRDTLHVVFSEDVTVGGSNAVWGYGPGSTSEQIISIAQNSTGARGLLLFFDSTSARIPGPRDSVRVAPADQGGQVADLLGNAPEALALWTPVVAGQRPPRYRAGIYPRPVLELEAGGIAHPIRTAPPLTAWVRPPRTTDFVTGGGAAGSAVVPVLDSAGAAATVGLRIETNRDFVGSVLIYDHIGIFVGSIDVEIDQEVLMESGLTNRAGAYELYVSWNGITAGGSPATSGVYLMRLITYRDDFDAVTGQTRRVLVENTIYRVGIKSE